MILIYSREKDWLNLNRPRNYCYPRTRSEMHKEKTERGMQDIPFSNELIHINSVTIYG